MNCEKYFRGARIYGDTKLANLLFTFELARKLSFEGFKNITVNAVHPGPVNTGLFRHIPYYGWIIKLLAQIFYYSPLVFYSHITQWAKIQKVQFGKLHCLS